MLKRVNVEEKPRLTLKYLSNNSNLFGFTPLIYSQFSSKTIVNQQFRANQT